MNLCYFITQTPRADCFAAALEKFKQDVKEHSIQQVFFFSNATEVASYSHYDAPLECLIDLADEHDIELTVCSAGFQSRGLQLGELGQQDFKFKGLGQFIAQSSQADAIRVF